ncbi:MAG: DUF4135 domain-containing protein [Paenibacillaceae bacterium]|nr:DUF4135 domain-containing protein [Paenibacillaceae bacterium]
MNGEQKLIEFMEKPHRVDSFFFGNEEEQDLPYKFLYMDPVLQYVKQEIENKFKAEKIAVKSVFKEKAGADTCYLFFRQLDLISQSLYREYQGEEEYTFCSYAELWKNLLKNYEEFRTMVGGWTADFTDFMINITKQFLMYQGKLQKLLGKNTGKILKIAGGDSDIHNGSCILILLFESRDRVVYKPRSLSLDQKWQQLLQETAKRAEIEPFYTPWILDCGDFGFEEFVTAEPVERKSDFNLFYYRCGFLLGLAYVLQGSDFHAENMIAHNNCPVLIDLETGVRVWDNNLLSDIRNVKKNRYCFDSVLRTNMLPFITGSREICPGSDALTSALENTLNLPNKSGECVTALSYAGDVEEGFRKAYDTLELYGVSVNFISCSARFLLRNTATYYHLLQWLCQKDSFCCAELFEKRLDYVSKMYEVVSKEKWGDTINKFIKREKESLNRGYIPRLDIKLSSVWKNGGEDQKRTIVELVENKIRYLCWEDREKQCKRIRIVLCHGIKPDKVFFLTQNLKNNQMIERLIRFRLHLWYEKLRKSDYIEGIVVCNKNRKYYLTGLPWNIMEGIPGLLPFLAVWSFITNDEEALGMLHHVAERTLHYVRDTYLPSYKESLSEGLEGLWKMTEIVSAFIKVPELIQMRELIQSNLHHNDIDSFFYENENKNIWLWTEANLENGFMEGINGVLFPSFFHGEGGWLYALLRRHYPEKIPQLIIKGDDRNG